MKKTLIIVILLNAWIVKGQFFDNAVSTELRYPVPSGKNFMNDNSLGGKGYSGIVDVGIEYRIYSLKNLGTGVSFNMSILRYKLTEVTATGFMPRLFFDYRIKTGNFTVVPQVAFGFTRWHFNGPDLEVLDDDGNPVVLENKLNDDGITLEGSVKLVKNGDPVSWFIQASYDYTRLEKPSRGEVNSDFNRNIQIIYPGLGVIWRF